jgi:hypothetical protein
MSILKMSLLEVALGVCRLTASEDIPSWSIKGKFFSVTKTSDELSVVCEEQNIPQEIVCERGWRALKVEGPLDFSLVGILSKISSVLAGVGVSIFAISTYDTDYILVKDKDIDTAVEALIKNEYEVV